MPRMIVDQAVYADGVRHPCSTPAEGLAMAQRFNARPEGGHGCLPADGAGDEQAPRGRAFVWVGLFDPSEAEVKRMAQVFDLHPLATEDLLTGRQRPKLDVFDDSALVVFRTLRYYDANSDVETGEVMLGIGPDWVLTVRHGPHTRLTGVRQRLESRPDLMVQGPASALFVVADHIVDRYTEVDAELQRDLTEIEEATFAIGTRIDVEEIYRLKREILEARGAVQPLAEPLRHLLGDERVVPRSMDAYFSDVQDHLLRAEEHVSSYDQSLTDILQAHLAMVAVQQGDDTRKISAWAALAAVPTLIAGIYGMNFEFMPELDERWGYPAVLTLIFTICAFLWWRFRRSGWL